MKWNYRVVQHDNGSYAVHEVYYKKSGSIEYCSNDPVIGPFESLEELLETLTMIKNDAKEDFENRQILLLNDLESLKHNSAINKE